MTTFPGLRPDQQAVVDAWFPGAALVADHSWGQVGRAVLQLRHGDRNIVLKAGDANDHHMDREIWAHAEIVAPLADRGLAPRLLHAEPRLRMLATAYLPGVLVEGTPAEQDPDVHRQAGHLLHVLHAQLTRPGDDHEQRADARSRRWLAGEHRIADDVVERLRAELAQPVPPRPRVPTHGDWQPRNWLVDEGRVSAIDFGRAEWRPAATDLARLHAQQFRGRPDLQQAFLDGYGADPRDPQAWRRDCLREAVGTTVWGYMVGDETFERLGHRMIADVLDAPP